MKCYHHHINAQGKFKIINISIIPKIILDDEYLTCVDDYYYIRMLSEIISK